MSKILSIMAMVSLLSACATKEAQLRSKQAKIYYGSGTSSLIAKNYTEALINLTKAAELAPEDSDIQNNLGMAFYLKQDHVQAKQHILKALELNTDNAEARGNYASLLMEEGKIEEAETQYKALLKVLTYDKQARTYYNLGLIESKRAQNDKAFAYFEKSVQEEYNYCPSHMQLGFIYLKGRNHKKALKEFREANMGSCVDDPGPVYYQALTYIEMKEFDNARIKLDEVITRFPNNKFSNMASLKLTELNQMGSLQALPPVINAQRMIHKTPEF